VAFAGAHGGGADRPAPTTSGGVTHEGLAHPPGKTCMYIVIVGGWVSQMSS
jgi:hypothetical protein